MITFEEVMAVTEAGPTPHTCFYTEECRAYFDLLNVLPAGAVVLEIGLQFGRSSSIALQVCKDRDLAYFGIDYFQEPPEAEEVWRSQALSIDCPNITLIKKNSFDVDPLEIPAVIHLALIDGDHYTAGVNNDCALVLPCIPVGGHVLFHDYGNVCLPEVAPEADRWLLGHEPSAGRKWTKLGVYMSLAVWRRDE